MVSRDDFSTPRVLECLRVLNDPDAFKNFPSLPLLTLVRELAKLTSLLGPALYFAARDIDSKIHTIEAHLVRLGDETQQRPHDTLGYPLRLVVLNEQKTRAEYDAAHPSVSSTFMRLVWFLDFTQKFTALICGPREQPSPAGPDEPAVHNCASDAYEQCLAPYHKPLVRVAVRLGLYACPSRNTFYEKLNVEPRGETSVFLRRLSDELRDPVESMWAFSRRLNLSDLR